MTVGIIGAGVAGLASAVRMASRGYEVHVFEANDYPGGKLSQFSLAGNTPERTYRFDAGPSLFTMPQYVEALFEAVSEDINGHFSYRKMDVVCQYFWDDGTQLTAWADEEKLATEVEKSLAVKGSVLLKALARAKHKYNLAGRIFLEKSLHRTDTWLSKSIIKPLVLMPTFDIFSTMNDTHTQLVKHPKLVQFLNRFATYNGSNPYKASGMLSVIPHFEHGIGCFYPEGGMFEITNSIYKLAVRRGVTFHFNKKIDNIVVENGRATGLKSGGETHFFDKIISNMDVYFTYKHLMPQEKHPEKTLAQERSTSALIFYWGIKKSFDALHLHNIFFSNDYKKEFELLADGAVSDDPTVYVNITSKLTPSDAPEGGENWFVMVNVPHNSGQDWAKLVETTRQNVLKKVSAILKTDIASFIEAEETLTPLSIESKTQSFAGALYGTSSNAMMAAFLRHKNFSSRIKNLYFCGGSVHPGGGIPLCLLSAKIVDDVMHD